MASNLDLVHRCPVFGRFSGPTSLKAVFGKALGTDPNGIQQITQVLRSARISNMLDGVRQACVLRLTLGDYGSLVSAEEIEVSNG